MYIPRRLVEGLLLVLLATASVAHAEPFKFRQVSIGWELHTLSVCSWAADQLWPDGGPPRGDKAPQQAPCAVATEYDRDFNRMRLVRCTQERSSCELRFADSLNSILGYSWRIIAPASDGKIMEISTEEIDSGAAEQVISLLSAKYGRPASIKRGTVRNKLGGIFPSVGAIWKLKGAVISFNSPADTVDKAKLRVLHPTRWDELNRSAEKQSVDQLKDL